MLARVVSWILFGCATPVLAGFTSLASAEGSALETDQERMMYSLGFTIAASLGPYQLTSDELENVLAGVREGVQGREPRVPLAEYRGKLQALVRDRRLALAGKEKALAGAFLEKVASRKGAVRSESGLITEELRPGTGDSPLATDRVRVHYHGTLRDGTVFDSSVQRGTPASFALNRVIKCWTEGVQKMKVGGKSRLTCPADIAYGDRGSPPKILPGAALVFEVELLEVLK